MHTDARFSSERCRSALEQWTARLPQAVAAVAAVKLRKRAHAQRIQQRARPHARTHAHFRSGEPVAVSHGVKELYRAVRPRRTGVRPATPSASRVVRFMLYVAADVSCCVLARKHDVAAGMRGRRPHQPSTSRRTRPTTPPTMCACARVRMPPRVLSRRVVCALSSSRGSVVLILFVCLCFGAQSDRSADSAPPDPSRRAHAAPTPCACVHARVRFFWWHLL